MQNGTVGGDRVFAGGVANDGSVILAGDITGGYAAEKARSHGFVVMKLDDDGEVLWTWQVKDRFTHPYFCTCMHG